MQHGFLGYPSTFMLDFVVTALALIVPALVVSLYLVKVRHNYTAHRNLQLVLSGVLLAAVIAFEVDVQLVHGGWEQIVGKRQPAHSAAALAGVKQALQIHLVFAISTPLLWGITVIGALRKMPHPPAPCEHSRVHKTLGWLSVIDLVMTSLTGLLFASRAFIA